MNWLEKLPPLSYEIPKRILDAIAEGRVAVSDEYLGKLEEVYPGLDGRIPASKESLEWNKDMILGNKIISSESPPEQERHDYCNWSHVHPLQEEDFGN
jgi:hypothetical protein